MCQLVVPLFGKYVTMGTSLGVQKTQIGGDNNAKLFVSGRFNAAAHICILERSFFSGHPFFGIPNECRK